MSRPYSNPEPFPDLVRYFKRGKNWWLILMISLPESYLRMDSRKKNHPR